MLVCITGCARHINAPEEVVPLPETRFRVDPGVRFTSEDAPALFADVYTPVSIGPFPTIVAIAGMDWRDGRARDLRFIGEFFAQKGFAVVAIEHRSVTDGGLPMVMQDLHTALRWVQGNARNYRFDTQRLGLLGFSSGGHLAALQGLLLSTSKPSPLMSAGAGLPPIRAVVAGGAPLDLTRMSDNADVIRMLGGMAASDASPMQQLHDAAPPFFLFHGGSDQRVPFAHAEAFFADLQGRGVPSELYRMHWRGHATTYMTVSGALQAAAIFLWRHVAEASNTP